MLGDALQRARQTRGETRAELGTRLYMSASMVNEIEHNRKRVPKDRRASICTEMDHGEVYLEMAREATGGVMVPHLLDNVDNHRMVSVLKFIEEVFEAIDLLNYNQPLFMRAQDQSALTSDSKDDVFRTLVELAEVHTAVSNLMIRVADTYVISLTEVWRTHEKELIEKGYLSKEKAALVAAR